MSRIQHIQLSNEEAEKIMSVCGIAPRQYKHSKRRNSNMATNQTATAVKTQEAYGIEWDVVSGENTDFTVQYPKFQWCHGNAQSQGFMKSGGLFVSAENNPNFSGDGFEPQLLITRDGTEIPGFGATKAKLAVIRIKDQWIKDEENSKNVPLLHALCVIKGCDDIVTISLRGASKSLAFKKAFDTHLTQNVAFANRQRPTGNPAIEPFALWFPLCAGPLQDIKSKDGRSASKVTPVEMCGPEIIDRDYVAGLWVGRENYLRFGAVFQDTKKWQMTKIWEQHQNVDADPEAPAFSGQPNGMTQAQIELIVGLLEVKNLDQDELKGFCLTATGGASNNYKTLSRDEATAVLDLMKAY